MQSNHRESEKKKQVTTETNSSHLSHRRKVVIPKVFGETIYTLRRRQREESLQTEKTSEKNVLYSESIYTKKIENNHNHNNNNNNHNANSSQSWVTSKQEGNSVKSKRPRVELKRKRRGLEKMKQALLSPPSPPILTETKNQKNNLIEMLLQYEQLFNMLGIDEAPTVKYETSKNKINDLLKMLILLSKIEEEANRNGMDFTLDIQAELKKIYFWMMNAHKLTKEDHACLKTMREQEKKHNKKEMLGILEKVIDDHHTPLMLRNVIHVLKGLATTKFKKKVDAKKVLKSRERLNKEGHAQKSIKFTPYNNKFANLQELIEKCNQAYAVFLELKANAQTSSAAIFPTQSTLYPIQHSMESKQFTQLLTLQKQREEARLRLYLASEDVLLTANTILKDPNTDVDKSHFGQQTVRKAINTISSYYFTLNQEALEHCQTLKDRLSQEQRNYYFVDELQVEIELDQISYGYVHVEENSLNHNTLEDSMLNHHLDKIKKHSPISSTKRSNVGSEAAVYIINDEETHASVVIRAKPMMKKEEINGSSELLRLRVTNSLGLSPLCQQYFMVTGAVDPLTEGTDDIRRDYEYSETVPDSKDLLDVFIDLHQEANQSKAGKVKMQLKIFDFTLQLVELYLKLAQHEICLTDLKPSNVLVTSQGKIKISDLKSLKTFLHKFLPKQLADGYKQLTSGFYTSQCVLKAEGDDTPYLDLELLSRQNFAFTLFQLLTFTPLKTDSDEQGHQMQYNQVMTLLSKNAPPGRYEDSKGASIPAVPMSQLCQGILGENIETLTDFIKNLLLGIATFKDIQIFLTSKTVTAHIEEARAFLKHNNGLVSRKEIQSPQKSGFHLTRR